MLRLSQKRRQQTMTPMTTLPDVNEIYQNIVTLISEYNAKTNLEENPISMDIHMFQQPSDPKNVTSAPQWVTVFKMMFNVKAPEDGMSDLSVVFFDNIPAYIAEYNNSFNHDVAKCRVAPAAEAKTRYKDSGKITIL